MVKRLTSLAIAMTIAGCSGGSGTGARPVDEVTRCDYTTNLGICIQNDDPDYRASFVWVDVFYKEVEDCMVNGHYIPKPVERLPTMHIVTSPIFGQYWGLHYEGRILLYGLGTWPHELVHYMYWASGMRHDHGMDDNRAYVECGHYSGTSG
jgi:hypothetical protein